MTRANKNPSKGKRGLQRTPYGSHKRPYETFPGSSRSPEQPNSRSRSSWSGQKFPSFPCRQLAPGVAGSKEIKGATGTVFRTLAKRAVILRSYGTRLHSLVSLGSLHGHAIVAGITQVSALSAVAPCRCNHCNDAQVV